MKYFLLTLILIISSCGRKKLKAPADCEIETKTIINYIKDGNYNDFLSLANSYNSGRGKKWTKEDLVKDLISLENWLKQNKNKLTFTTFEEKSVEESKWGTCYTKVYCDTLLIYEGWYTKQFSDNFELSAFYNNLNTLQKRIKAADLPAPPTK